MQWKYDFTDENGYEALQSMIDKLGEKEITAIHKAITDAREEGVREKKEKSRQLFEYGIIPVLVEWAESSHATMDVTEESELVYIVTLTSVYGFKIEHDNWVRYVLAGANCISSEVFKGAVLLDLIFDFNDTL